MDLSNEFVSVDVEPGGKRSAIAFIGVAEMRDNELTTVFSIKTRSPFCGRSKENRHLPPMRDALIMVDAFVGNRLVSFFWARYDSVVLRKLHRAVNLRVPNWEYFCGWELSRRTFDRTGQKRSSSLQSHVLDLKLFTTEEIEARRQKHRRTPTNKWLLHDAADDAAANALLVAHWSRNANLPYRALLSQEDVTLRSLRNPPPPPKPSKVRPVEGEADVNLRVASVMQIASAERTLIGARKHSAEAAAAAAGYDTAWRAALEVGISSKELRSFGLIARSRLESGERRRSWPSAT